MKKFTFLATTLGLLMAPASALAEDVQVCTQAYGTGVVCGVHTVVNTGLGENLAMAGIALVLSSIVLHLLGKKLQAVS